MDQKATILRKTRDALERLGFKAEVIDAGAIKGEYVAASRDGVNGVFDVDYRNVVRASVPEWQGVIDGWNLLTS